MNEQNKEIFRVLLFSNFSPKCKELKESLSQEHLNLFKPICIDSEEIREIILNSENINIEYVPCLLEGYSDGTIAKYENEQLLYKIKELITKSQPQVQPQTINNNPQIMNNDLSHVDSLIHQEEPENYYYQQSQQEIQVKGLQSKKSPEINIQSRQPDVPMSRRGPRGQQYNDMLSSERDLHENKLRRPVRGDGHEEMISSLQDIGKNTRDPFDIDLNYDDDEEDDFQPELEPENRSVVVGRGKQAKIIQDITPMDDENDDNFKDDMISDDDPSGMGIPRTDNVPIAGKSSSKSSESPAGNMAQRGGVQKTKALKNLAAQIAAAREKEEKKIENMKQGPIKNQRNSSKGLPISM